ncbi:MAG: ABC transporter permease [Candidatus Zixiibacteriota bacterium]|nr:MAG: ABC transporter permease [candidate division Zixibacteria bacterium]
MLKNYLITVFRNLVRHKGYSFINIGGLAVGMAACILIMAWVVFELSYDRFHENADRLHRVVMDIERPDESYSIAVTPVPLAPALENEFMSIERSCRVQLYSSRVVRRGHDEFPGIDVAYADGSFFKLFTFPMVQGDPPTALADPSSVVITESMSARLFGGDNPVGRVLNIQKRDFVVTGVLKDPPQNSHLVFDCLLPITAWPGWAGERDSWAICGLFTYVQLADGTSGSEVAERIADLRTRYMSGGGNSRLDLQPITRIHLHRDYSDHVKGHGDIKNVYLFAGMACFILLIAIFNYMNLSTARAADRTREVGIRRLVGAQRASLLFRFYAESITLSFVALGVAIVMVECALPAVSEWTGKPLSLAGHGISTLILALGAIALFTGLASGSYPALVLSSVSPMRAVGGILSRGKGGAFFRRVLVTCQFAVVIVAMIGAIVIAGQLEYVQRTPLGFTADHFLYAGIDGEARKHFETMRAELLRSDDISGVTAGSMPMTAAASTIRWDWEGKNPDDYVPVHPMFVDYQYAEVLGLEILRGRDFTERDGAGSEDVMLVNEAAVKVMGFQDPIGKRVTYSGHGASGRDGRIIGVVKDFHYGSLHSQISPTLLMLNRDAMRYLGIRTSPDGEERALAALKTTWRRLGIETSLTYVFMDDMLASSYYSDERLGVIYRLFVVVATFVLCLGLFGMGSYSAECRRKEISIRKVLGATVSGIVQLLSREFLILAAIANAVAWPIAYYAMNRWLQDFAYRIELGIGTFVLAGLAAMLIALLTVSYQAIRAAWANPVEALKYE